MTGTSGESQVELTECNPKLLSKSDVYTTLFTTLLGLVLYLVDVGSDIFVAYQHFHNEDYWWGGLTLLFVVISGVIISVSTALGWVDDEINVDYPGKKACRIIFRILLIYPLLRYLETLLHFKRSGRQSGCDLIEHSADSSFLALVEDCLEDGPQFILQLYIIIVSDEEVALIQIISCGTSLFAMALSVTSIDRAERREAFLKNESAADNTAIASIIYFIWRVILIASRVLTLSIFASVYSGWLFLAMAVHVLVMTVWVYVDENVSLTRNHGSLVMHALIYILFFYNGYRRPKLRVFLFYTLLVMAENTALITLCWFEVDERDWYYTPSLSYVVGGYVLGTVVQVLYYLVFYPKEKSV